MKQMSFRHCKGFVVILFYLKWKPLTLSWNFRWQFGPKSVHSWPNALHAAYRTLGCFKKKKKERKRVSKTTQLNYKYNIALFFISMHTCMTHTLALLPHFHEKIGSKPSILTLSVRNGRMASMMFCNISSMWEWQPSPQADIAIRAACRYRQSSVKNV